MTPAAAVSGIYLAHPDARYFSVGRIGRDQLQDYAARKGLPVVQVEKWLLPNLVAAALIGLACTASALADSPTVRITSADQAKAVGACSCTARTSARAGGAGQVKTAPLTAPNCPGFDPKESDLVVTGHADARYSFPQAGVELDQDVEVLKSAAMVEKDFARSISPLLGRCIGYQLRRLRNVVTAPVEQIPFPATGAVSAVYRAKIDAEGRRRAREAAERLRLLRAGTRGVRVHRDRADRGCRPARQIRARAGPDPPAAGRSAAGVTGRAVAVALASALALAAAAAAAAPDPKVHLTKADQAIAKASLLRFSDLGAAWSGGAVKPQSLKIPLCPADQPNDSDLVITGHAESTLALASQGLQVDADVEILQTARQVETLASRDPAALAPGLPHLRPPPLGPRRRAGEDRPRHEAPRRRRRQPDRALPGRPLGHDGRPAGRGRQRLPVPHEGPDRVLRQHDLARRPREPALLVREPHRDDARGPRPRSPVTPGASAILVRQAPTGAGFVK